MDVDRWVLGFRVALHSQRFAPLMKAVGISRQSLSESLTAPVQIEPFLRFASKRLLRKYRT